jgi:Zn-finger nucleic acid-binding protein
MSEEIRPKFYDYVNVYEFTCELPGSKQEVKFKPVNTGELKKLLTYENETNLIIQEQALDDLITSSILSEDFNIDELYLEDRFYLLVELRKKSKGEVLEFSLTCPQCKSQTLNRVDLNKLPMKPLDPNANQVVDLGNGIKVHLRRLKRKYQKADIKPSMIHEHLTPTQKQAEVQILYHACAIDKVETESGIDENLKISDKKYLLENIPTGEYDKIRDKIDELSFGTDLTYKIKCKRPNCKFEWETIVPLENNFFS